MANWLTRGLSKIYLKQAEKSFLILCEIIGFNVKICTKKHTTYRHIEIKKVDYYDSYYHLYQNIGFLISNDFRYFKERELPENALACLKKVLNHFDSNLASKHNNPPRLEYFLNELDKWILRLSCVGCEYDWYFDELPI